MRKIHAAARFPPLRWGFGAFHVFTCEEVGIVVECPALKVARPGVVRGTK